MIEIRLHGRGGQGTVTAAELIAEAAYLEGKFSQAFPSFGIERRGAPVEAFVRISDKPIILRSQIYKPDYLIIQDPTLIGAVDVFQGIKKTTFAVINTEKNPKEISYLPKNIKIQTVPATQIALEILGKPIINTILLGAFAGTSRLLKPFFLEKAILNRFKNDIAEKNIKAMNTAYRHCNPDNKYCFEAKKCQIKLSGKNKFSVAC